MAWTRLNGHRPTAALVHVFLSTTTLLSVKVADAAAQDVHVLPMPNVTPGKADTSDLGFVCSHVTKDRRRVRKSDKAAAYREYDVPAADQHLYVIDHLVPLDLGGSNVLANLWPQ